MISRLTAFAALFAVVASALLVFAAGSHGNTLPKPSVAATMPVVQLEPVLITAKRRAQPTTVHKDKHHEPQ